TGDAVNVAARLEQAAHPGEILVGEETHRLARDAIEAEPVEPLALKGKSHPLSAYRLLGLREAPERRRDAAPMVGRRRQLKLLEDAYANAVEERSCQLFTVLGTAGVGKSRLVAEVPIRPAWERSWGTARRQARRRRSRGRSASCSSGGPPSGRSSWSSTTST